MPLGSSHLDFSSCLPSLVVVRLRRHRHKNGRGYPLACTLPHPLLLWLLVKAGVSMDCQTHPTSDPSSSFVPGFWSLWESDPSVHFSSFIDQRLIGLGPTAICVWSTTGLAHLPPLPHDRSGKAFPFSQALWFLPWLFPHFLWGQRNLGCWSVSGTAKGHPEGPPGCLWHIRDWTSALLFKSASSQGTVACDTCYQSYSSLTPKMAPGRQKLDLDWQFLKIINHSV